MNMTEAFKDFDAKYSSGQITIDRDWYKTNLNVISYSKSASSKSVNGHFSEEYIRARFVYSMIVTNKYKPECICVEASFPKGNKGKAIEPDILVFKSKEWVDYSSDFSSSDIRQNILVVFEAKKDSKSDIKSVIDKQLRTSMNEVEGDKNNALNFTFGVYFDDNPNILIFKKENNHPIKRFDVSKINKNDPWNLLNRDNVDNFPSHADFINKVNVVNNKSKLLVDNLEPIDSDAFEDLLVELNKAKDRSGVTEYIHSLIVEFLTYKVYDEKYSLENGTTLQFYRDRDVNGVEEPIQDFRARFMKLQTNAKADYTNILSNPIFNYTVDAGGIIQPNHLQMEDFLLSVIQVFEMKSILKANNENFNQIIFNNFGSAVDKAVEKQFFTPIPAAKMMIDILNPNQQESILDPCSGICDFLAVAFRKMHKTTQTKNPNAKKLFGFDKDQKVLKLAELNLVLNGDGGATIHHMNSLTQKLGVDGNPIQESQFTTDNYSIENWSSKTQAKGLMKFDVVVTNPPFGKGRDLSLGKANKWDIDKKTAQLYETYWLKSADFDVSTGIVPSVSTLMATKKHKLPSSMDMGVLFLENAVKMLNEGGRMAIVLSNSIASIQEWEKIRAWFLTKMRLVATIDLPTGTFGETAVATTVLVAYKPKKGSSILNTDYQVFPYEIKNIGYEVKTKKRLVVFEPRFKIDEVKFTEEVDADGNKLLLEDFSDLQNKFITWIKCQEEELRKAFHHD